MCWKVTSLWIDLSICKGQYLASRLDNFLFSYFYFWSLWVECIRVVVSSLIATTNGSILQNCGIGSAWQWSCWLACEGRLFKSE